MVTIRSLRKSKSKGKVITIVIVVAVILLICAGGSMAAYQAKHFNKNVSINGVNVGGLTAKAAVTKLEKTKLDNNVWLNGKILCTGKTTASDFTAQDAPKVKEILKKQYTFFPSTKEKNYNALTGQNNDYRTTTLKDKVQQKLVQANKTRTPAQDAYAVLKDGKVSVVQAKDGDQYNVTAMMNEYDHQINNDKIDLKSILQKPLTASSKEIETQKTKLQDLAAQSVDYKVEDQTYTLPAKEMITSATYSDGKYKINAQTLKDKIDQINKDKATLNKKFNFTTSNGKKIQVQGKTYGWAINVNKAIASIENAYEKHTKNVDAKADIYGLGYNRHGTGYGVTSNDGIGNTYAELSIQDQHAWFYKDGKLVDQVDVVTGNHQTHSDTPTGVYYIMYQQSPSILRGTHPNGQPYSCQVQYWSQFTDDGCGFHDAWWRHNWAKDAYLTDGSDGCANIKPSQAKQVYDSLKPNEPVVVY